MEVGKGDQESQSKREKEMGGAQEDAQAMLSERREDKCFHVKEGRLK